jgi:hypothetical protein
MSTAYEKSRLWRGTLGASSSAAFSTERERLKTEYFKFRERASQLAGEVSADLREFTVHDITHIDALWDLTDVIVGETYTFNPLEAFVLGSSFLLHDLGMALASHEFGLKPLTQRAAWPGYLRAAFRQIHNRLPTNIAQAADDSETLHMATGWILRDIHADTAEHLIERSWKSGNVQIYLMDDQDLRQYLGALIGKIAKSHGMPVHDLPALFPFPLGAPVGFPGKWTIDGLRIAATLRLADAAHIDAKRAPTFLRLLRNPKGNSLNHWLFQGALVYQPVLDGDRLRYTGNSFPISEAKAWWLCVDTLRMVDKELRQVDNLLVDKGLPRFAAKAVLGVEDPLEVARLIPTQGWQPIDAQIKVTGVASLVGRLGGKELYGDNNSVPLRELIQNASDAIKARRILEGRPDDWGQIILRTGRDSNGSWIEIEDNGIGMSKDVLSGALLDFGNSYWNSMQAFREFPKLSSGKFESTGKYGIGFFSLFMWGDRVQVTTRRFDYAASETFTLTFDEGVANRPVLRQAISHEMLIDAGTRIRVWPSDLSKPDEDWLSVSDSESSFSFVGLRRSPREAAYRIAPALEVNLFFQQEENLLLLTGADSWKSIQAKQLISRCSEGFFSHKNLEAKVLKEIVRPLYSGETMIGRGCIAPQLDGGTIAVGGLRAGIAEAMSGVFIGESTRATRDRAIVKVPAKELAKWVEEQRKLIAKHFSPEEQAKCSRVIGFLGGSTRGLCLARVEGKWLTGPEISKWATNHSRIFIIDEADERDLLKNFNSSEFADNVAVEPVMFRYPDFFITDDGPGVEAEATKKKDFDSRPVLSAIAAGWQVKVSRLEISNGDIEIGVNGGLFTDGWDISVNEP